jgi:hypothetical protein
MDSQLVDNTTSYLVVTWSSPPVHCLAVTIVVLLSTTIVLNTSRSPVGHVLSLSRRSDILPSRCLVGHVYC